LAEKTMVRGRIAPTPTGYLHLGHAATFLQAAERAEGGVLVFRQEDLDAQRCGKEFAVAAMEDLRWLGLEWQEGPDIGGAFGPYEQSRRTKLYLEAWRTLRDGGWIYPCQRSRRDVREAGMAPHQQEPVYPAAWRPPPGTGRQHPDPSGSNWRFRVPDGRVVAFQDERTGKFSALAGVDFGDFPVWRRDGVPAYELAVVVDDAAMEITEVVRGEDLLLSTCRQLLLYEALQLVPPAWWHTELLCDQSGKRLAKREDSLCLRALRKRGIQPSFVREAARRPADWFVFIAEQIAAGRAG